MFNKKTFVCLGLAIVFALPVSASAGSFQDVKEDFLNYQAIEYLKAKNVIHGYQSADSTQSLFNPEKKVNRVEALKIILDAFNKNADVAENTALNFSDIQQDAWYIPYLKQAVGKNVVKGYDDSSFRPANTVNLAEALKMIAAVKNVKPEELKSDQNPFADIDKTVWFAPYFQFAKQKHLIDPDSRGLTHPSKDLTRADLSEIVYRLMYAEEHNLSAFLLNLNWREIANVPAYFKVKFPFGWNTSIEGNRLVFWKKDDEFQQFDYLRQFPNSASVIAVLFDNNEKISKKDYFDQIKSISTSYSLSTENLKYNKVEALRVWGENKNDYIFDIHYFLPNDKILVFYGNYGKGIRQEWNKKEILFLQDSFVFLENGGVNMDEVLTKAKLNIGIDEKGREVLDLFSDLELIETDSIGVGTGPVDYYFSALGNVTLKYERSFDVILGMEEGETNQF